MTTVPWNELIEELGVETVRDFVNGTITRKEFEGFGALANNTVRSLGVKETRTRARKALRRRNVSV